MRSRVTGDSLLRRKELPIDLTTTIPTYSDYDFAKEKSDEYA
ncbi:MAG: hypothetical protein JWL77_4641 [Chthonomonadaceae bacterium]|nr:hypothetical protein [Chthonomonadaceae bacterium]